MDSLCALVLLKIIITTNGLESRVFGAHELPVYNHKYLVKLQIFSSISKGVSICSGSIISPYHVITSGHCISKGTKIVKVLHRYPHDNSLEVIATVLPSGITELGFIHGIETARNTEKDLALLHTLSPIEFNEFVQPINLAKTSPRHKQSAVMAGFGMSEPYLTAPREGMIRVLLSKSCPDIRGSKLLCSYSEVRAGSGDSGGPLVSKGRLIGVISASCSDVGTNTNCSTIYVDVARNLKWIKNNMWRK